MATLIAAFNAPSADRGGYYVRCEMWLTSQSIDTNTSYGYTIVTAVAGGGLFDLTATSWSFGISGATSGGLAGSRAADFSGGSFSMSSGEAWTAVHASDGTRSLNASFSWAGAPGGNFANGFAASTGWFALPIISRATIPTFSAGSVDAGSAVTVNLPRSSASFTHNVTYEFGAASGVIASGAGTSASWTPPLSLLSEIPSAVSGVALVRVVTMNGAMVVGERTATLTVTAPSSVVPDFTTITHAETVAAIGSIVGGYVQGRSKLALAITGAAGVYGSSITGYGIEVASQVILAASGTSSEIAAAGSVAITGTITDSRGRTRTKTVTVTVLAYGPPAIVATQLRRANAGGTPAADGIYLRVDLTAAVQSLIVGTQRNALGYRISTKLRSTPTWTPGTWTTPGGIGFAAFDLASGTIPINESRDVRIEVRDELGTTSLVQGAIGPTAVQADWPDAYDAGAVGQKYDPVVGGSLQAAEVMYQRVDKRVLDVTDLATDAVRGIVELATSAEVIAGADTVRAVTPAGLASLTATDARRGLVELATTAEARAGTATTLAVTPAGLRAATTPVQGQIPSSVQVGSGSASVAADGTVTFSGASSVSLNGVFDGLGADMYEIVATFSSSGTVGIGSRLRVSGVDQTSGYAYAAIFSLLAGTVTGSPSGAAGQFGFWFPSSGAGPIATGSLLLASPGIATAGVYTMHSSSVGGGNRFLWLESGNTPGVACDGYTLRTDSGGLTGKIKIVKVG